MVFQSGALFDSLTVAENIAFPLSDRVGIDTDRDRRPRRGIGADAGSHAGPRKLPSELSTGTKRAVAIARALAQDPEAILYDEPTTMVDPLMAAHTSDLILKLKATLHKTSVVVTHDTHLGKKVADKLVFLEDGRVAYFGPWAGFEASRDPFLRNFRLEDELIPALDATFSVSFSRFRFSVCKVREMGSYGAGEPGCCCWRFHSFSKVASRSAT